MYVMQYEVTLPADYDMKVIRHRVATKGRAFDTMPGLGLKAFAIRERDADGSPVNQYAPFYLWTSLDGMNHFLWGGAFDAFCDSFGRPAVQQWTGVAYAHGPAREATPGSATRSTELIPADAGPAVAVDRAVGELQERALVPQVHSTALAVDTRRWEMVHFTLWQGTAPEATGTRYEVLHVSAPQVGDLKVGRYW
jgi:hypothetical protein